MSKKNERICCICGASYSFCPVCNSEDVGKPSWYFIFDSENCHDIYEVCVGYRDKVLSAKEAYERISKLDISGLEDFNVTTAGQIKEIISLNEKNTKEFTDEGLTEGETEVPKKITYPKSNKKNNASDFK